MRKYKSDMSVDELRAYPGLFPKKGIFMPVFSKLKSNNILFLNGICYAKLKLHDKKDFVFVELKHTCNIILFIFLIVFVFLTFNIFREDIIINNNYNPALLDRFIAFGILFLLFSIFAGILYRYKTYFVKHIEKELKLKQL